MADHFDVEGAPNWPEPDSFGGSLKNMASTFSTPRRRRFALHSLGPSGLGHMIFFSASAWVRGEPINPKPGVDKEKVGGGRCPIVVWWQTNWRVNDHTIARRNLQAAAPRFHFRDRAAVVDKWEKKLAQRRRKISDRSRGHELRRLWRQAALQKQYWSEYKASI